METFKLCRCPICRAARERIEKLERQIVDAEGKATPAASRYVDELLEKARAAAERGEDAH